ncbi:hypothetical protein ACFOLG_04115 [Vogesella facilis]|uniref:Uncharacterized protein n=1 Tax=Vogesella facilis TaxID=1655232 RepID=A0ABV7RBA0_9NEIS
MLLLSVAGLCRRLATGSGTALRGAALDDAANLAASRQAGISPRRDLQYKFIYLID